MAHQSLLIPINLIVSAVIRRNNMNVYLFERNMLNARGDQYAKDYTIGLMFTKMCTNTKLAMNTLTLVGN